MHLYENGVTEWFVAESVDDAKAAALEFNSSGTRLEPNELDLDFVQTDDDKVLTMRLDECEPGGGQFRVVSRTAAEWAATSPRGFLMTTEY